MARPPDTSCEEAWLALEADPDVGTPDILVNNAGINPGPHPLETYPLAEWRRIHAVNLDGVFLGCRYALRTMGRRSDTGSDTRGGTIINIASATAKRVSATMPAYCASKAAVIALTRSVALYCEQERLPIRCNFISPGSVETPMIERLRSASGDAAAARARTMAAHPVGFVGAPADVAAMALFLASDQARFITGAGFAVDGG